MDARRTATSAEPIAVDGEWIYPAGYTNTGYNAVLDDDVDSRILAWNRAAQIADVLHCRGRSIARTSGRVRRARSQLVGARRRPAHRRTSSDSSRGDPSDLADESEPARGGR